ncbi:MAG: SiaB family protein kinase [Bacteroidales bacterium]
MNNTQKAFMTLSIDDFYYKMNTGDVILAYKGSISSDLITNVLEVIDAKLEDLVDKKSIKKKLYNVLVESLQNLYHHIDDLPDNYSGNFDVHFGIFVIAIEDDFYKVSTGNFIRNDKIDELKERLDNIKNMDIEELKELYKFILNNQKFSKKGGGGLGLIDMAKRTNGRIDYEFTPYNDEYSFFNLVIFV